MTPRLAIIFGILAAATCSAAQAAPRPLAPAVAFETLKVLERPTLALTAIALQDVRLPPSGKDVPLNCNVQVPGGRLYCSVRGMVPPDLARAAMILVGGYRVETSGLAAGTTTLMSLHLDPIEPPQLDRGGAEPIPSDLVTIAVSPSARDVIDYYPPRAMELDKAGTASLTCKILSDLSFACPEATADPPKFGFEVTARRLAALMRAAPALKNGEPAEGRWFTLKFRFSLAK